MFAFLSVSRAKSLNTNPVYKQKRLLLYFNDHDRNIQWHDKYMLLSGLLGSLFFKPYIYLRLRYGVSVCVSVYIWAYKCMRWRWETSEREEERVHEEKERKGGLENEFPRTLKAQYTQTVKYFHCGQITA